MAGYYLVSAIPVAEDVLAREVKVLPLPDVAELLGIVVTRVHQLLRDGQLLAIRRDKIMVVPADFFDDEGIVKHLSGTITLLRDGGFDSADILRWMFTEDASLSGTPIAALRSNRSREIKRRAQAMAF